MLGATSIWLFGGWLDFDFSRSLNVNGCPTLRGVRSVGTTDLESRCSRVTVTLLLNAKKTAYAESVVRTREDARAYIESSQYPSREQNPPFHVSSLVFDGAIPRS